MKGGRQKKINMEAGTKIRSNYNVIDEKQEVNTEEKAKFIGSHSLQPTSDLDS